MKDMLGRAVKVGDYVAYAKVYGRSSAIQSIYHVREIVKDGGVKAHQLCVLHPNHYEIWDYSTGEYQGRAMTPAECKKLDEKTTKISQKEQMLILDNFDPAPYNLV